MGLTSGTPNSIGPCVSCNYLWHGKLEHAKLETSLEEKKIVIQVWNSKRVSKWWQCFHLWVKHPFKCFALEEVLADPITIPLIYPVRWFLLLFRFTFFVIREPLLFRLESITFWHTAVIIEIASTPWFYFLFFYSLHALSSVFMHAITGKYLNVLNSAVYCCNSVRWRFFMQYLQQLITAVPCPCMRVCRCLGSSIWK